MACGGASRPLALLAALLAAAPLCRAANSGGTRPGENPHPDVKVKAVGAKLTLQRDYAEVAADVVRWKAEFAKDMAETLDIERGRVRVVRIHPIAGNDDREDRVAVHFLLIDPPEGRPVRGVEEASMRLSALVAADRKEPWSGQLNRYIMDANVEVEDAKEALVPIGQFDGTDPDEAEVLLDYDVPAECDAECVEGSVGGVHVAAGCAEHLSLSPGASEAGTPWCMVAVKCSPSQEGFGGRWVACERGSTRPGFLRSSVHSGAYGSGLRSPLWKLDVFVFLLAVPMGAFADSAGRF